MWSKLSARLRGVGRRLARAETLVLLTLVYFLVLPLFALSRLADPLGLRQQAPGESRWRERPPVEPTVDRFTHPF